MQHNPARINYGFQYGEETYPGQAAGNIPPYYPSLPQYSNTPAAPINTYYSITAVQPHAKVARKGIWKSCCVCIAIIVTLLILAAAAVLIWHFVFGGVCAMGRKCGQSSSCVSYSKWCDGNTDCPGGEDEAQCFRFYGPSFMLQSFSRGDQKWKVVCSDQWSDSIGKQTCQEIGYSTSDYVGYGTVDPGSQAANGYMALKSDKADVVSSGPVHRALSNSTSCLSNMAVTLKCNDCGKSDAPASRIVGGVAVSSLGRWPWQVSLQEQGSHTCGGSIITPSWIVTAAHCVHKKSDASKWKVYAGYLTLQQMTFVSGNSVAQIIPHPNYNPQINNENDVALMKLSTALKMSYSVKPVCLPNFGLDISTSRTYYITGWGTTKSQGSVSNELREAQISLISKDVCNSQNVYNGIITNSMVCAGKLQGGMDTCQGDSGGPLVTSENFLWWLVGDTSWGQGCAVENKPGIYGNVTLFVDWIYKQMKKY